MPICFRYQISCLDSGKTHMFKPNAFDSESPTPTHRTFGALYNSAYDKVARNDFARVLWEVGFSFTLSITFLIAFEKVFSVHCLVSN